MLRNSTQELRARILSERERINVRQDSARWQQLLRTWNDEAPRLHLEVKNREPSTDDVWRVPADDSADVQLVVEPWTAKPEKIEWFALTAEILALQPERFIGRSSRLCRERRAAPCVERDCD